MDNFWLLLVLCPINFIFGVLEQGIYKETFHDLLSRDNFYSVYLEIKFIIYAISHIINLI